MKLNKKTLKKNQIKLEYLDWNLVKKSRIHQDLK
jgi:hypothetical protein